MFVDLLRDLKPFLKLVQLRQHKRFVTDEEIAVALVFEELFEIFLAQHIGKRQERSHVAHVLFCCLGNVEDHVGITNPQCDLAEALISFHAQPWLDVLVRGADQGEPETPLFRVRGG